MKISPRMWEALVGVYMEKHVTFVYFLRARVGVDTAKALERRGLVTLKGEGENVGWHKIRLTPAGRKTVKEGLK